MLKRIIFLIFIYVSGLSNFAKADEGMWLPLLLKKLNEADMQKEGLKLSADDLYNINHSSMKDAIVRLGTGFCTAEMISGEGLMLTNHHCAYESIQQNSNVGNDFLTNGFWAKLRENELPNPDLTADFLIRIEDVTPKIIAEVSDTLSEAARTIALQKAFAKIIKESADSNGYKAEIKTFFKGNAFYLFFYQTYKDVRLVGAPPGSIGKFGGNSDNWMWPRHTGDFALLRVYMSKDGKPAPYSKDNIPYKPKYFLPVSLEGIKKDDFAFTMGYPGNTDRYLTSEGVKLALEVTSPAVINIRAKKLAIIKEAMDADNMVRIMYSVKYYESSNYYKYFIGQSKGLKRMQVIEKKQAEEEKFNSWANSNQYQKEKYGQVLQEIANNYKELRKYALAKQYFNEAIFQGAEVFIQAYRFRALETALENKNKTLNPDEIKSLLADLKLGGKNYFKNYHAPTDQRLYGGLLKQYYEEVPKLQQPGLMNIIAKKYNDDFDKYAAWVFKKTIFSDSAEYNAFLNNPSAKKLKNDPVFQLMKALVENYFIKIMPEIKKYELVNTRNYRYYIAGLQEMNPGKKFYSDANSTMRLSYGKVADYVPMDAVYYNYFTTIEGIMQKKDNSVYDYQVPEKLYELYNQKDYGRYGEKGTLPVCFITDNDITGGSSGSPVINGKGELIGLAFDGNWEAMSGDIAYDPLYKRCINVDIRYVLFIIDKFAGASNLLKEMKIIGGDKADSNP